MRSNKINPRGARCLAAQGQWRLLEQAESVAVVCRGRVFWQQRKRRRERF